MRRLSLLVLLSALSAASTALAGTPRLAPSVARHVPKGALIVGAIDDPGELLTRLGVPAVIKASGKLLADTRPKAVKLLGADPFDLAAWSKLGIDKNAPAGFALVDEKKEQAVIVFGLSDVRRFEAAFERLSAGSKRTVERREVGDAVLLIPSREDDFCIVVQGKTAVIAIQDRGGRNGMLAFAERIARLPEAESVSSNAEVSDAIAGLGSGLSGAFVIDVAHGVRRLAGLSSEEPVEPPGWSEKELARARERNAPADEIARLEQQARREAEWRQQRQDRRQGARAWFDKWLAPTPWLAFGLALGPRSLQLVGHAPAPATSPLGRLLASLGPTGRLLNALDAMPSVYVEAGFDPATTWELIDDFGNATFGKKRWQRQLDQAGGPVGLDFKRVVTEWLGGKAGLALSWAPPSDDSGGERVTGAGYATFRDMAGVRELFDRLIQGGPLGFMIERDSATGGYILFPGTPMELRAAFGADSLTMGNQPALQGSLASGGVGAMLKRVDHPELLALLRAAEPVALGLIDFVAVGATLFLRNRTWAAEKASPSRPPPTPQEQAIRDQLAAIDDQEAKLEREQDKRATKTMTTIAQALGPLAGALRRDPKGYTGAIGLFVGAKRLDVAVKLVGDAWIAATSAQERDRKEREKLWKKRSDLEQRLQQERAPATAP